MTNTPPWLPPPSLFLSPPPPPPSPPPFSWATGMGTAGLVSGVVDVPVAWSGGCCSLSASHTLSLVFFCGVVTIFLAVRAISAYGALVRNYQQILGLLFRPEPSSFLRKLPRSSGAQSSCLFRSASLFFSTAAHFCSSDSRSASLLSVLVVFTSAGESLWLDPTSVNAADNTVAATDHNFPELNSPQPVTIDALPPSPVVVVGADLALRRGAAVRGNTAPAAPPSWRSEPREKTLLRAAESTACLAAQL